MVGFSCGMASIACWIVAQIPQLVQNYRTKKAEALSPWFLAQWLMVSTMLLTHCGCSRLMSSILKHWLIWLICFAGGHYKSHRMLTFRGAAANHDLYSDVSICSRMYTPDATHHSCAKLY